MITEMPCTNSETCVRRQSVTFGECKYFKEKNEMTWVIGAGKSNKAKSDPKAELVKLLDRKRKESWRKIR